MNKLQPRSRDSLLSVCIPVFNEIENLEELFLGVTSVMTAAGYPYEVILTDNGSTDGTREKIHALVERDPRWKGIFLSRNFGHQSSLLCGLEHSTGEAIISIDGDLQDPPPVIAELIRQWEQGADVVSTVRSERPGEAAWRLFAIRLFYRLVSFLSGNLILSDSGDFRLVSRRALDSLLKMPERNLFIRGLLPLVGFNQKQVTYDRNARHGGRSKMFFFRLLSFALDGITSTSIVPLRAATALGFLSLLGSSAYLIFILWLYARGDQHRVPGWTSIILLIIFYSGLILMTLGVIGEYLGRVFKEVKGRPHYFVEQWLGEFSK